LNEFKKQDVDRHMSSMAEKFDDLEDMDVDAAEEEARDEDAYGFEDAAEVARVENADEVAAQTLAIRCASEHKTSDTDHIPRANMSNIDPTPNVDIVPSTEGHSLELRSTGPSNQIRHKKSFKFSKSGAFHAHAFSKSIGRGAKGARGDVRNMGSDKKDGDNG